MRDAEETTGSEYTPRPANTEESLDAVKQAFAEDVQAQVDESQKRLLKSALGKLKLPVWLDSPGKLIGSMGGAALATLIAGFALGKGCSMSEQKHQELMGKATEAHQKEKEKETEDLIEAISKLEQEKNTLGTQYTNQVNGLRTQLALAQSRVPHRDGSVYLQYNPATEQQTVVFPLKFVDERPLNSTLETLGDYGKPKPFGSQVSIYPDASLANGKTVVAPAPLFQNPHSRAASVAAIEFAKTHAVTNSATRYAYRLKQSGTNIVVLGDENSDGVDTSSLGSFPIPTSP